MTNIFEPIKQKIIDRLKTAGVNICITYPDEISYIGNYYPMAIVQSDNADVTSTANNQMLWDYYVNVFLITQSGITQSKVHEDMLIACLAAIYIDNNLGGTARNVNPMGIQFNADLPYVINPDLNNAIQVSMIQFQISTKDNRI